MKDVYIGIDIGGMSFKVGVVDINGNILYRNSLKSSKEVDNEIFKKDIETLIDLSIQFINEQNFELKGIGVGVPGTINNVTKTIIYTANLSISNLNLEYLSDKYNVKFLLSNDANVACLGEKFFGAAKGYSDVVLLTLGTGIGGGVISSNNLIEGHLGCGTELGHTCLVVDGLQCSCGRKGCFEKYASATALLNQTKEKMLENKNSMMWQYCDFDISKVSGLTSFECAKKGDQAAIEVIDNYIKYLGEGCLDFANIFRPQIILIGGGISNQGSYLTNKLENYIAKQNYGYKNSPKVEVKTATLKNDAGIIGAASLVMNKN